MKMKKMVKLVAFGVLLMLSLPSATQQTSLVVRLRVEQDGKERPGPDHVILNYGGKSAKVPLHKGKFEVPPKVLDSQVVTFVASLDDDELRISDLPANKFNPENWTIVLADRTYSEEYQWDVSKGAAIRSSCIITFNSIHSDPGTVVFVKHCRTPKK